MDDDMKGKGGAAAANGEHHHANDETRLRQLGYKQELRRELNLLKVSLGGRRGSVDIGYSELQLRAQIARRAHPAPPPQNFAVSFGLLSMLTGLGGFLGYGYSYGGPVVVVWGWVSVVRGCGCWLAGWVRVVVRPPAATHRMSPLLGT